MALKPNHYQLEVWKESMRLARDICNVTQGFPEEERFGLVQQMRRAAVSVASNIAEGAARGSRVEYARFLRIARASLMELDTQFLLARDLGMTQAGQNVTERLERVFRLINGLLRSKSK